MLATRKKWQALNSIWIGAMQRDATEIACEDEAAAKRLQNNLYAARRRARHPRNLNPEVNQATGELSITRKESTLIIYRRQLPNFIEQASGTVDETSGKLVTPDESFAKLEKLLGGTRND